MISNIKEGDFIRIGYTGRVKETGELFDTTSEKIAKKENVYNPEIKYGYAPVIIGAGNVVSGLEKILKKMVVGEEKKAILKPEDAFGKRNPKLIKVFSEAQFRKEKMTPYPGMRILLNNTQGRILSVNSGRVRVDFNHPLAGKEVVYRVKIEKKITGKKNKIEAVLDLSLGKGIEFKVEGKIVKILLKKEIPENLKKAVKENFKKYMKGIENVKFEVKKSSD